MLTIIRLELVRGCAFSAQHSKNCFSPGKFLTELLLAIGKAFRLR